MQKSMMAGFILHYYSTVDSTNNFAAISDKQSKLPNKTAIMAEYQSKGKGQYQNKWESERGKNILLSLFVIPNLEIQNQFLLSCATALSIKDTVSYFLNVNAKIKWPNDIYVKKKKIAGILIENSISGKNISRSIIGIGLNINQTKFKSGDYNSFKLINKISNNRKRVLEYLIYRFNYYYEQLDDSNNGLKNDFDNSLFLKDELISFKTPDKHTFKGKITGTDNSGKLKITLENNDVKSFNHKEVFFS